MKKIYHEKRRTVLLNPDVYERLKTFGMFGETYSDVINRLMDEIEERKKK